ncbi:MAG: hypothetical protein M0T80_01015 [Actinomycetota bacterium]|nr:hypothetical protein [Actinomycetota bacterium]
MRQPVAVLGALLLTAASLGACGASGSPHAAGAGGAASRGSSTGGGSTTTSSTGVPTTTTSGGAAATTSTVPPTGSQPVSAAGLPDPCGLVPAALVGKALEVTIGKGTYSPDANGAMCTWTYTASSLVKGLGSNADLLVERNTTGSSRSEIYQELDKTSALRFAPVTIDGIPAVHGFGDQVEVFADLGPVTVTVAALSTISASLDGHASLAIADAAVAKLCRSLHCSS